MRVRLFAADPPVGEGQLVAVRGGRPPKMSIIAVRTEAGVVAYWNVCMHLPIPLDGGLGEAPCDAGEFVCFTHGARYRYADGFCVEGPCEGSSLEEVPVEQDEHGAWYALIGAS